MSVVLTVKNGHCVCYCKYQNLSKADSSAICSMLVGSKHGPGFQTLSDSIKSLLLLSVRLASG